MQNTFKYIKAIDLYRNNGEKEEAEKLQRRLVEIQKKKPTFMAGFKNTYDVRELNEWMNEVFEDLSFEEAIIRLTQFTTFKTYESMKKAVFDDLKSSPISHMFGQSMINEKGQTIINLPPLDLSNPEKDIDVLNKHIHQKYYSIEDIEGNLFLNRAIYLGSVVTNHGYSDWATTEIPSDVKSMWYRFSRREDDYCKECSADGRNFSQMRVCHMWEGAGKIRFGIYACSPEESSFRAVFTNLQMTECAWKAHDGQQPD